MHLNSWAGSKLEFTTSLSILHGIKFKSVFTTHTPPLDRVGSTESQTSLILGNFSLSQHSFLDFAVFVCLARAYYIPDLLCLTRPQFLTLPAQSSFMAIHVLCI